MDQQIFNLNLSVHATSAYIVLCSLREDGLDPTLEALRARWTAEPELLERALGELLAWNVAERRQDREGNETFPPNPASLWSVPGSR